MLTNVLHGVLGLSGWQAYLVVGALCCGEAALFLGFIIPGETAVILGGVMASEGHASIVAMVIVVVGAAIVGDTCGYAVGRHFGPKLLARRPLRGKPAVDRTRAFVQKRGGPAVFFGRFTAVLRALVPGIAGLSHLQYRRFLFFNALGALVWGTAYTLAGYAVGKSYEKVEHVAGDISYVVIGVVVVGIAAFEIRKRVRERRRAATDSSPPTAEPPPVTPAVGSDNPD